MSRRLGLIALLSLTLALMPFDVNAILRAADEAKTPSKARPEGEPAIKTLMKPKNWPQGHPLPVVGSNCASCHLTAGRELTAAVINFARSVHDLNAMTCYDCHGGNS